MARLRKPRESLRASLCVESRIDLSQAAYYRSRQRVPVAALQQNRRRRVPVADDTGHNDPQPLLLSPYCAASQSSDSW